MDSLMARGLYSANFFCGKQTKVLREVSTIGIMKFVTFQVV